MELALREARSLGHDHIGTEHVLLGLVRVGEGVAVEILATIEAPPEAVHPVVIGMLGGLGRRPGLVSMPTIRHVQPARRRSLPPVALLVTGWLLFAAALGLGVLVGWAIWG